MPDLVVAAAPAVLSPGASAGFSPRPDDYVRRIRLGSISPTVAVREYLTAVPDAHTETDVNTLARDWGRQAGIQREMVLGDQLARYRQRARELLQSGLSTTQAETQAFTELAPEATAQQRLLDSAATTAPAGGTDGPAPQEPTRWLPSSQDELAPSGEVARIRANLDVLRTLRTIQAANRPATADEQAGLARWSGWGAVPGALDPINDRYAWVREALADLLDERELAAARRTVINAHYTDFALVQAIWAGMAQLGFTGGQVLEPGCGAGNFIAGAPDAAQVTGVELDPTTAAIAAALHPQARILTESFAATRVTTGSFDAAVGNVPFGGVRLHDKRDNLGNHSIHNHFILKALRATRPGGLTAVITSAYTMDATNPAARREMQQMGDLVGAVRLPSKAHARAAGTDALTDVLVFRRREDERLAAPFDWEYTSPVEVDGTTVRVNSYFLQHPDRMLGRITVGNGLYRRDEVSVTGDPAGAPAQLREALAQIAEEASRNGLTMSAGYSAPASVRAAAQLPNSVARPDGYLRANDNGTFSRLDDGEWEPYAPPKTQAAELRALLGLRDTAVTLLEAEAATLEDTSHIDRIRGELNRRYNAYQAKFGPINRFTDVPRRRKDKETGKMVPAVDEETGEQLMNRKRAPQGGFRHDPFAPVVQALEVFNEETQTAKKADIFHQRVVSPRPARLGADTPGDALAIVMDECGEVRLPTVAWLLGIEEDEARQVLGQLVFEDPATGRLEPAAGYLSGDVKTKLAIARNSADEDDRYAVNVEALTEVVPPDLTAGEISDTGAVKMGAPWIGEEYVQQFLREILEDSTVKVEHGGGGMWTVHSSNNKTVLARSTWGTERRSAAEIAQHILEQRDFVIKDTVSRNPKRQVVNLDASMAATEKAVEMRERFLDWIWEDPDRAATLVARSNDTFQRYVLRNYDDMQLSLPGLARAFKPDPHQVAGVARMIHEPAVGLYHTVGGGKTATIIMGLMELRRLGLVRKPVVVAPNQLLDQWVREFLRLYPQAKILAASSEDLEKDQRRLMVARMATGDWDAVILTEAAFEMLPMSTDAEQAYIDQQMAQLDEQIREARAKGAELTLKRLETKKANREARLEERLDSDKDAGIWWELTGIDYIARDESHRDKNLRTVSKVPGISIKGSQRASQMDIKLGWLRERHARWGTRATGTPLANSIVEMYTEFRYLRPDLMEQQGITDIDSWLATYAEGKVIIEVTPDGGGLRNKTRLDFVNLDKLVTALHVFADVKLKDDLNLQRPQLAARADGQRQPEMVVVQPSAELLEKVAELVERAAKLKGKRPEKGDDNILTIVNEGSAAALDLRLVGLTTDEKQKLDVAADRIAGYYHANKDRTYLAPDGQPHPTPGALQQAFCDMGTPNKKDPKRWTAYGYLRQQLVARAVPREKIRFIHEAEDDRARAELFASCRDGRTAVLISSTEKGGTGVNAQDRMLVLHHLDTPYRPCDLEQREGRIDRRGNQNEEIRIERYVTERSLDAFKWQKVAYKASLAERVLTGRAGARSEDIGDVTLSYEEMKAAATGNPLLVDHATAKVELTRLDRLKRGYNRTQSQLRWTISHNQQEIGISRATIAEFDAAIARRVDTRGNAFAMTVRGTRYTNRSDAKERIRNELSLVLADPSNERGSQVEVGEIGGFAITAALTVVMVHERGFMVEDGLTVQLRDVPSSRLDLSEAEIRLGDIVARLENRLAKLESVRVEAEADIQDLAAQIRQAEQDLTKPFRHADVLEVARARFRQLDIEVAALAAASEAEANAAAGGDDKDSDENEQQPGEPNEVTGRNHQPGTGRASEAVAYRPGGRSPSPRRPADQPSSREDRPIAPAASPATPAEAVGREAPNGAALPAPFAAAVAAVVVELLDRARVDVQLLATCRHNALDEISDIAARRIQEHSMDSAAARPGDEKLNDFFKIYFANDGTARRDLDTYLIESLYAYANTPIQLDLDSTVLPSLWAATYRSADGEQINTILTTAVEVERTIDTAVRQDGLTRLSREGQRTTVRNATADVTLCAEPADLPWRAWRPKEADTVHLGRGSMRHYEPGNTLSDGQWNQSDVRDVLRRAQDAGTPLAVTDWGILTVYGGRTIAFVRDGSSMPAVPAVPDGVMTLPAPLQPFATVATELVDQALRDERLVKTARLNSLSSFRSDAARWVAEQISSRTEDGSPSAQALYQAYGEGSATAAQINEHVAIRVYATVRHPSRGPDTTEPESELTPTIVAGAETPSANIPEEPRAGLPETKRRRRGHDFYPPADLGIPGLYDTEGTSSDEKVIYAHYFSASSDWWIAEYNPGDGIAFGYACQNQDADNAEWGYIHLPELERAGGGLNIVERDLYWEPRTVAAARLPDWRATGRSPEAIADPGPQPSAPPHVPEPPATEGPSEPQDLSMTTPITPQAEGPAGLGADLFTEFDGGTPYTSGKRIRGPLLDVRKAYNAVTRTHSWKRGLASPGGGRRIKQLATTAEQFAAVRVGETHPWNLLIHAITMARHTRELWSNNAELDEPARKMLVNLVRTADTLARDLTATLRKEGRWERVFGTPLAPPAAGDEQPDSGRPAVEPPAPAREPSVHRFDSSAEAYDATQGRDDIRSGDVLAVESEDVVGVLDGARPVAVSENSGAFHRLADSDEVRAQFAEKYQRSVAVAAREITVLQRRHLPPPAALAHVPLGDSLPGADGQHTVSRRVAGRTVVFVEAYHPQHPEVGPIPRGRIRLLTADDATPPRFRVIGPDHQASETRFDSYDEAERRLLTISAKYDAPISPERLAEWRAGEELTATDGQSSTDQVGPEPFRPQAAPVQPEAGPEPEAASRTELAAPTTAAGKPAVTDSSSIGVDAAGGTVRSDTQQPSAVPSRDSRHPAQLVACTCCQPAGAEGGAEPADAGAAPRSGPFAYEHDEVGLLRGNRWLKVVGLRDGQPRNALAFVDLGSDDWCAAASWKSPKRKRRLDADDKRWIIARLPYLTPEAAQAAQAREAAVTAQAGRDDIRLQVDGQEVTVRGTRGGPDEEPLRRLMRDNGFYYDKEETKAWRLGGWRASRGSQADRDAAVTAVQKWIDANSAPAPAQEGKKFPPTPQQQAIIDAYLEGKTVVVQALAGTGKTTTLQLLADARPDAGVAYIAFNRSIAKEAAGKFGRNVTARTSHGFARAALAKSPLRIKLDRVSKQDGWPEGWAQTLQISDWTHGDDVVEAAAQAKWVMATVQAFRQSDAGTIAAAHLPDGFHDPAMAGLRQPILDYARKAWGDKADPAGQLPFVHDDYLKLWALQNPRLPYDVIFFDEAQDINPVLRKIIQDQPTQIVVVGDSNQSIYAFRGAVDALNHWPADVVLPLTQSWRFGPAIAETGNDFLRLIGSPYQLAGNPGRASMVGVVDDPDAVLAFTNAGCVAAVFDGFEAGKEVALTGGGKAIKNIAEAALDLQAGRGTKHPELSRFADWKQVQEYVEEDEHAQSLRAFVRLVDRRGAEELIKMADRLTDEEATRPDGTPAYDLTVSTVHKSKGLEWDQVRIAGDGPHPEENLATGKITLPDPEQLRQAYVAVTRGREQVELGSLSWIQDCPMDQLLAAAARDPGRRKANKATTVPQAAPPVVEARPEAPAATANPTLDVGVPVEAEPRAVMSIKVPAHSEDRTPEAAIADELFAQLAAEARNGDVDLAPADAGADQHEPVAADPPSTMTPLPESTVGPASEAASGADAVAEDATAGQPTAHQQELRDEVRRALNTVPPGGDIRWAVGAYHLSHVVDLMAYWRSGDVRTLAGGQGGNSLDGARWFRHDTKGCTVTDGNDTIASATWHEIAQFITAKRVGAQLVARADTALEARRAATPDHSTGRSAEEQEQWFKIEAECQQIAAEAWHACRSDPHLDTPNLFEIDALRPTLPATVEAPRHAELAEEAEVLATGGDDDVRPDDVHQPDTCGDLAPEPNAGEAPQEASPASFSEVELALVAHACEDYARNYIGGPFHLQPEDAVRYVADHHLETLEDRHGRKELWQAVRAYLKQHPEILQAGRISNEQRERQQAARDSLARRKSSEASREFRAGNRSRALELLAEGELASPTFWPGNGRTWEDLRGLVLASQTPAATDPVGPARQGEAVQAMQSVAEAPTPAGPPPRPSDPAAVAAERPTGTLETTTPESPAEGSIEATGAGQQRDRPAQGHAQSHEAGFMLYRDAQSPRPLDRNDALKAFSAMIGQVESGAQVAGRLGYAGAFISIGRTSAQEPALRIAFGTRQDHQDVPVRQAWPEPATHAGVFDWIVKKLDSRATAAVLHRLHGVASRHPSEMIYMPYRGKGQSIEFPAAVDRFAEMVDAVQRTGSASGELAWRGVAIRAHLADSGEPRLAITIAGGHDQHPVPLIDAWPTLTDRANLLRRITNYIDRAGQHAARLSQAAPAPRRSGPEASALRPAMAAAGVGGARPTAGQAFPGRPRGQAGGETRSTRPVEQPAAGRLPTGRPR